MQEVILQLSKFLKRLSNSWTNHSEGEFNSLSTLQQLEVRAQSIYVNVLSIEISKIEINFLYQRLMDDSKYFEML